MNYDNTRISVSEFKSYLKEYSRAEIFGIVIEKGLFGVKIPVVDYAWLNGDIEPLITISSALNIVEELDKKGLIDFDYYRPPNPHKRKITEFLECHDRKYDILVNINATLIDVIEESGKKWMRMSQLAYLAQIRMRLSQWVGIKTKKCELVAGVDYRRIARGHKPSKTDYLITLDAAIKMLKGVKFSTQLIKHIEKQNGKVNEC